MNKNFLPGTIICGMLLASGIASGGYFIGQTMYNAKVALNTAEAKGLAERRVKADLVNWQMSFSLRTSQKAAVPQLYKNAEQVQIELSQILKKHGFSPEEIKLGIIDQSYSEIRDQNKNIKSQAYTLSATVAIESNQVALLAPARREMNKLISKGYSISNNEPRYTYTKLNQIKPEMLKEATSNARMAANEFAKNANVKVGGIRNARQGNFYIRDAGSEYGDSHRMEKDVRVVTTITFYLDK
ncbi:SIMPL domain-containing protein [Lentisphaera profundi]|uniref:SIMPL domain-containing protein n=1 Tax=Lentisphaera profundi TaxID=1658616 RepID=A0ABY7W1K0_9BACT|nr:SIMPL domain-containing protein [Lentisphaera profundi]WDE99310.1 SIMPL domain-containing protein [Lentisphaera profundi]